MTKTRLSFLSLMAVMAAAQPAFAHDGWGRGDGWGNNGWRNEGWRNNNSWGNQRRVSVQQVYVQPAQYYQSGYYAQPANYGYDQATTVVNCNRSVNPITGLLGGAAGGIAGSAIGKGNGRTAAIITGAILGVGIGGAAGAQVKCTEQVVVHQGARPAYQNVAWQSNPGWDETAGRYCREYQGVSTVAGRQQQTYGTACMQPDGSWEVVN